jgi:two-component system sensor histidine kinase RegB
LHLRWLAVVGQLVTILAAGLLTDVSLPYVKLLMLVGVTAVTNLIYGIWLTRVLPDDPQDLEPAPLDDGDVFDLTHAVSLGLMLLDLVTLTVMLYFSSGPDNPFSFFYFVNLAVGGVMIRPRYAWSLTLLAVLGYTFLLHFHIPVQELNAAHPIGLLDLRTVALMFAFGTCASVVTYYVTRTAGELQERELQLRRTQAAQAASQRLEGLTTLAAGAAHELATPLSTIDVIVRELSRHLEDVKKPETVETDLKLIESQLEMCRQILQRMRSAAGDSMAQRWDRTTVGELIDTTLEGIRDPHRVDVTDGSDSVEQQPLWVPQEAVAQAVRNLIHNGLDASGEAGRVRLESTIDDQRLRLSVSDEGAGMTEDVLGRVGDPFFTTKEPGRGIGLGLFLARNVISQLGGRIDFRSQPGLGTTATVLLPLGDESSRNGNHRPASPIKPH